MAGGIKTGAMIAATAVVLAGLATGLVFATTALFTDEGTVTGRITAGDMQIGLYQTSSQSASLDDDGYIEVGTKDEAKVDLLGSEEDYPLFDMTAVPGVWTEKTIEVDGTKSDVAFSCVLSVADIKGSGTGGEMTEADKKLAENIEITVTYGENSSSTSETFMLLDYDEDMGEENDLPTMSLGECAAGQTLGFTMRASFDAESDVTASEISGASITFDINITATQIASST